MDIVKRLRSIDHMNVEECFVDSYLYAKAADEIERLRRIIYELTRTDDDGMTKKDYEAIYGRGGQG